MKTTTFHVRSVNNDGTISKARPTKYERLANAFATLEGAEARRAKLEAMNPGRRFAVVAPEAS